jgi:hypothetical protein
MAVWMGADKLACGYIVNQQWWTGLMEPLHVWECV